METITVEQSTTDIPIFSGLAGVAVVVYWSDIEITRGRYDFGKIEAILQYWAQKQKKVILDVATIGYPMRAVVGMDVQPATPAWLLARITTYAYPSQILGDPARGQPAALFPDFRDSGFRTAVEALAKAMSRFDGHQGLAQVRIPVGLMGEDNPLVGPPRHHLPWYTENLWLDYCTWVAATFRSSFSKTQLEFDIGRLGWMSALGNETDKSRVARFVQGLLEGQVLLAFNGLTGRPEPDLDLSEPSQDGITECLRILKEYKRKGGATGLEAARPMAAPTMSNIAEIIRTVEAIAPARLILFDDFLAGCAPDSPQWKRYEMAYGPVISARVTSNSQALMRILE